MGDFNAHSNLWDHDYVAPPGSKRSRGRAIVDFLNTSEYVLMNDGSHTRITQTCDGRNSALDISLVHQNLEFMFEWKVSQEQFGSDHLPTFLISKKVNVSTHKRKIWNLDSTQWDVFNANCIMDIEDLDCSVEELDCLIGEQILKGLEASTKSHSFPSNHKRSPVWFDTELNDIRKEKNKALKVFIKSKLRSDLINLKKLSAAYKRMVLKKKDESWIKFVDGMDEELELKDLWKRVRNVKGSESFKNFTQIKNNDGKLTDDPVEIPNIMANFFKKISSKSSLSPAQLVKYQSMENENSISFENQHKEMDEDFTLTELRMALSNTKDSAPGPDGLKYRIYKMLNANHQAIILELFNRVWRSGARPESWKLSHVIPFPKCPKADSSDKVRPINLFNTRPKLFDKMVNNRLIYSLEVSEVIDSSQFGFRQNKQTLDSMIRLDEVIRSSFMKKSHVQLVSFDIKKAFDSVWPESILKKFIQIGIGGRMFEFVKNYLGPRKFVVVNGAYNSDPVEVDIGVPQGSPLSSTLFLVAFQLC